MAYGYVVNTEAPIFLSLRNRGTRNTHTPAIISDFVTEPQDANRIFLCSSIFSFRAIHLSTKMSSGRPGSDRFRFPAARSTATTARMP